MMHRILGACAALGLALALTTAAASADPVITSVLPSITAANTGATVVVTGTGFGNPADRVYFPGTNNYVTPIAWGPGSVTVRVPGTWSGNVQIQTNGVGNLSNAVLHDITFSFAGNLWPSTPVHWRFNTSGAPANAQAAIQAALWTWECASNFSSVYDGTTSAVAGTFDGVNTMSFNNSGWGNPNIIAVTNWWWNGSGQRIEADIAFNTANFTWNTNGSATDMDIQNIATHESGHWHWALDLYGADDTEKTMYGFSSNGETKQRSLTDIDEQGAEFSYGHSGRADLDQNVTPGGWYLPLVPRATNDATGASAPLPATLPGGGTTYLNAGMTNSGADCASPWSTNYLYVDDNLAFYLTWNGVWNAGATYGLWTNWGTTISGGRHTLRIDDDVLNEIPEGNKGNNRYDAQYVWSPLVLATDTPTYRPEPPDWGPFGTPNTDGFQYTGDWWGAVAMVPTASNDDYDMREFDDYANSTTGFANVTAASTYGAAENDFVVWNNNILGFGATRWAGNTIYAAGTGAGAYVEATNRYANTYLGPSTTYGTSVTTGTVSMGAYDLVKVHELYLTSSTTTYAIHLNNLSGSADLNISIVGGGTGMYSRVSALATSANVGGGTSETINFVPTAGTVWYGVVVWKRGTADLGLANTYELTVGPELTDLDATVTPSGFDWPVVPRNDATAAAGNAHVSPTLDGNTNDTYVNLAVQEISPNAYTPGWGVYENLDMDNTVITGGVGANTATNQTFQGINIGTLAIRGGRHSLTNIADPTNAVPESNENNNSWSGQWIWSPTPVSLATGALRGAPPNVGPFSEPNDDGLTFTRHSSNAWVAGVAPTVAGDDYDLIVYGDYTNSTTGFSSRLGYSAFGGTATDFVVGHYFGTPVTLYPAAVRFLIGGGGFGYSSDQNDSYLRDNSGAYVSYLNQVLGPNRIVDVYEGYFTSGVPVNFQLLKTSGPNIKLEVFPGTTGGIYTRGTGTSSSPVNPSADALTFTPGTSGWHPIVVFKQNGVNSDLPVTYSLIWSTSAITGVEPHDGTELALDAPSPNPFAASSRVSFTLAQAGHVSLAVFDVGGRRMKTLADGEFGPGAHALPWDGSTEAGTRATDGLYWIRMESAGRTFTRRIALIH